MANHERTVFNAATWEEDEYSSTLVDFGFDICIIWYHHTGDEYNNDNDGEILKKHATDICVDMQCTIKSGGAVNEQPLIKRQKLYSRGLYYH